jgi:prepilin-type processing-associated H-X9-DG protein/prepilin-type N-terminal cleavage/methylation domain-containing protein
MNWITKFILVACAILAIAGTQAIAHVGYSGRDFGTLMYNSDGSGQTVTIATQTISSGFGWADATDMDWGDSHRGKFFRFSLSGSGDVQITAQRNLNSSASGIAETFLPAFSLFSGLGQLAPEQGGHDSADFSIANRQVGTEGSVRALGNWSIGNDPTYNTAGDPTSGILYAPRLAYFTYIGNAADGTSANYGSAAGIFGDGNADGYLSATFKGLAAGDYSLWVGGANYGLQSIETGPSTFPTYGVTVSAALVPEPSTGSLILSGAALLLTLLRIRKGYLPNETTPSCKGSQGFSFLIKRSSRKQPAFTLVELLTVVTIISILSTLGVAATRGVTERTKTTRCLNDLKEVGVALQLYVGDNSGRFPNTSHQGVAQSWTNTLADFLKTNFLGRCYAVPKHRSKLTYAWNDSLADAQGFGVMAPSLRSASSTMVVAELATNLTGEHFHFSGTRGGASRITPNQFRGEVNVTCHGSSANYLFADGHVENLPWTEVQSRLTQPNSSLLVP